MKLSHSCTSALALLVFGGAVWANPPINDRGGSAGALGRFASDRYARSLAGAVTARDRDAVLGELRNAAAAMLREERPGYGDFVRFAASQIRRGGDIEAAKGLLRELVERPETLHDAASSLRMLGQIAATEGDLLGAARDLRASLELGLAHPDEVISVSPGGISSAATQYVAIAQALGRPEDALWANGILLGEHRSLFEDDVVRAAMGTNSAIYRRLGDPEQSLRWLERLFQEFPSYGLDSEQGLGTRLTYLRLKDPTRASADYLAELQTLWDRGQLNGVERLAAVGQELVATHLRRNEDALALSILQECGRRLESLAGSVLPKEAARAKEVRAQVLRQVVGIAASLGQTRVAYEALLTAQRLDPTTSLTEFHYLISAQQRLQKGQIP